MKYNVKYVEYPNGPWHGGHVTRETHYSLQDLNASLERHGYGKNYANDMNENGLFGYKPDSYDNVDIVIDPTWWERKDEREEGMWDSERIADHIRRQVKSLTELAEKHRKNTTVLSPGTDAWRIEWDTVGAIEAIRDEYRRQMALYGIEEKEDEDD